MIDVQNKKMIVFITAHSQILANLFVIVKQGLIKVPLAPEVQDPTQNLLYIQQLMPIY
jgi:hypothetical protein